MRHNWIQIIKVFAQALPIFIKQGVKLFCEIKEFYDNKIQAELQEARKQGMEIKTELDKEFNKIKKEQIQ